MKPEQIVPIITTDRIAETRALYVDLLGFEVSFDHDRYLGLRVGAPGSAEIGFMRPDADAPSVFAGRGLTLGITVADADRECARLRSAGVVIDSEPADQPWGGRSFTITDPSGVALLISHSIAIAPELADHIR